MGGTESSVQRVTDGDGPELSVGSRIAVCKREESWVTPKFPV